MARMCRSAPVTSTRCLSCWGFPDSQASDDADGRCCRRHEHAAHENRGEPCRGRADQACVHNILHHWRPQRGDGGAVARDCGTTSEDATTVRSGSMEPKWSTKLRFGATELHHGGI